MTADQALRVLVVTQYFWPENFQINRIASSLRERGHTVTVLTGKPNYPGGKFFDGYSMFGKSSDLYNNIPVIRVPLLPRGSGNGIRLALNYLSFAFCASILGVHQLREEYDVIFTYEPSPITVGLPAIAAKKKKNIPIIFWVLDLWPESISAAGKINNRHILSFFKNIVKFIYRRCDLILVQSESFRSSVEKYGANPKKIKYFPQSTSPIFRPIPKNDSSYEGTLMPHGFKIMFAGNIGEAQDFETIIEAAEELRSNMDIQWIILGDGRRKKWLMDEVNRRNLSDRFHILGAFPEESMPRFFSHADAMLITLRDDPIFSLTIPAKLQSYLACGKPIVAGLNGEGARIVEAAGAGISAPAGNPKELAAAIIQLSRMTDSDRKKLGKNALAYSKAHFDPDNQIDQLEKVMRSMVAAPAL